MTNPTMNFISSQANLISRSTLVFVAAEEDESEHDIDGDLMKRRMHFYYQINEVPKFPPWFANHGMQFVVAPCSRLRSTYLDLDPMLLICPWCQEHGGIMLTDDEEIDMLNHEEDFRLPQSYFPKDAKSKKILVLLFKDKLSMNAIEITMKS